MGYIKPFSIILISLLSMQFANSNESLECLILNTQLCLQKFVSASDQQRCGVDQVGIQCLKEVNLTCNYFIEASAMEQVRKIEQLFKDICQQGSEMNIAFLKHKDCCFGEKLSVKNLKCAEVATKAVEEYKLTGITEEDKKAMFKIACKYRIEIRKCASTNAKEICEEGAESVQSKLTEPFNNLGDILCNNTSATFMHFWTILFQATAILMSFKYFKLMQ